MTFKSLLPYIYAPHIPAQIKAVRSTLGPKEMDATHCHLCQKKAEEIKPRLFQIISKMEGDFDGTPIDSEAIRAIFCPECFYACADEILSNFFKQNANCGIIQRSDCFYCKRLVFTRDLIKYFIITNISLPRDTNRVTCYIHEECYNKHIDVSI